MGALNLNGKKGLIIGIANEKSIGAGCAKVTSSCGAKLAITYYNDKAKGNVLPIAKDVSASIVAPLNVLHPIELDNLFTEISNTWGTLDFIIHSIAYCDKETLHKPVVMATRESILKAVDISCYSLIEIARRALPLMPNGGSIITMSYHGATEVVDHYNAMGPVKAMLEGVVKYLAADLGPSNIRVNAISPGTINTRAASAIEHFDALLQHNQKKALLNELATIEDVGQMAAFLASDFSKHITAGVHYVDSGYHHVN